MLKMCKYSQGEGDKEYYKVPKSVHDERGTASAPAHTRLKYDECGCRPQAPMNNKAVAKCECDFVGWILERRVE
jgi:hypothetical protein